MLSPTTIQQLDILHKTQNSYEPNPTVQAQLSTKTLFAVVGATSVGKNTVMETAAKFDPRFRIAGTFTSRERRETDNPSIYMYYQNSDEGLQGLLAEIAKREVVQYAVNTHSHLVYGSHLGDYSSVYNLRDVFSGAITGFRQLGFKQVVTATIITDPDAWLRRFEARFPMDNPDRAARRDEAIDSLTWSLAQPNDGSHFWIENIDGQPEQAAKALIAIADGTYTNPPHVPAMAQATLNTCRHIDANEEGVV
jgi:hypothetical protein